MILVNVARVAVVAVVFMAVGCSSSNKGKIEGTKWSSNAATVQGKSLGAGALMLEFKSDGKLVYKAGDTTWTGTYSLGMGDSVTFNTDQKLGNGTKNTERININGNTLTMKDSDGTSLTFTKSN